MATQAYYTWVAAGRPWRLATPIAELVTWAKANGFRNLGTIGDESHLTANFPQDHTPFSYTAWPVPLPGYVVTAIDLGNDRGLGEAILAKAKQGQYPWLKYMNFNGRNYDSREGWRAEPNSDYHVHLSIRTDWITRSIGAFNPFEDTMTNPFPPVLEQTINGISERTARAIEKLDALLARPVNPPTTVTVDVAQLVAALRPVVREEVRAAFTDGGRT